MPRMPKKSISWAKPKERSNQLQFRTHDKFYDTPQWRAVRKSYIQSNPLCAMCKAQGIIKMAKVVDHIIPRSKGGDNYDNNNLQSLCTPCHNRKSQSERK